MKLYEAALNIPEFEEVLRGVSLSKTPFLCVGLSQVHKAHIGAALRNRMGVKTLVLTPDEPSAVRMFEDIKGFCPDYPVYHFPAGELNLLDTAAASGEYCHRRLACLEALRIGNPLLVASCEAALQYTISPMALVDASLLLKGSFDKGLEGLVTALNNAGYKRLDQVEGSCTYAVRGGIVDFFTPSAENPVRVEFWGDDIDSIAFFNEENQRREGICDEIMITPASEAVIPTEKLQDFLKGEQDKQKKETPAFKKLEDMIENSQNEIYPSSFDRFLPVMYGEAYTLFDHLDENSILIISDTVAINQQFNDIFWQFNEDIPELLEKGICYKGCDRYYADKEYLFKKAEKSRTVIFEEFARTLPPEISTRGMVNFKAMTQAPWGGELDLLLEEIRPAIHMGESVAVLLPT
ncbi:MAG: hypothetical protein RR315_01550, partial [Oscillospiraceae bacterium]